MERGNRWLRWLDRDLGPVLLRVIALFRGKLQKPEGSPRKIGLIKAAAIGDTVLLSAMVSDLKKAFPESEIHLFVGASNLPLAPLIEGVTRYERIPLKNPVVWWRILRQESLDWIIDADAWPRISALWAAIAKARFSVGFKTKGQERHYAFDAVAVHSADQHELENYRDLLRVLGVPVGSLPQNFSQHLPEKEASELGRQWEKFRLFKRPLIGLHPWPGGLLSHLKEWPEENWIQVIRQTPEHFFVLTGGPSDRERNELMLKKLSEGDRKRVFNAAGLRLDETIRLLTQISCLISVNTGILHLAAAVECPVLGLHGPTNPKRWGPVGDLHLSLLSSHKDAACLNLGFEYPEAQESSMHGISLESALKALKEIRKREL